MTRPLSSAERSAENRRQWNAAEERKAKEERGEQGQMEFWLRITRSQIAKNVKAGRGDVYAGFTLVCRLFQTAMDKRSAGEPRLWNDLMQYAQQVVEHNPPRH